MHKTDGNIFITINMHNKMNPHSKSSKRRGKEKKSEIYTRFKLQLTKAFKRRSRKSKLATDDHVNKTSDRKKQKRITNVVTSRTAKETKKGDIVGL